MLRLVRNSHDWICKLCTYGIAAAAISLQAAALRNGLPGGGVHPHADAGAAGGVPRKRHWRRAEALHAHCVRVARARRGRGTGVGTRATDLLHVAAGDLRRDIWRRAATCVYAHELVVSRAYAP